MILVFGATGTIGSQVLRLLVARGEKVRAVVHSPAGARRIRQADVEVVQGDLDKPETLDRVFEGVEKVFLVSPAHPRQVEREGNAVEAARRAGVRHIVKLSALGARIDSQFLIGRIHGEIERKIEESGIPYTHLRPHFYMQNLLSFAEPIKYSSAIYAPVRDGKIGMVHVRDIAAVAATVLTEPGHRNKIYEITGPEAVSLSDVAGKLSRITGEEISFVNVPMPAARQNLVNSGVPDWMADATLEFYELWAAGKASKVTDTVAQVTGRWPITLDKFLEENKDSFMPG